MKKQATDAKSGKKKASSSKAGHWIGNEEFSLLQRNLSEAQETLEAIRSGAVDAVVVSGPHGNQVYSLTGAEQPYRVYVERMQEGAATISHDGVILYANRRFADMVNKPLEQVISSQVSDFLDSISCKKFIA